MRSVWRRVREGAGRLVQDQSAIASIEYLLIAAMIYCVTAAAMISAIGALRVAYAYMMEFFRSPVL